MTGHDSLDRYTAKRDFTRTPEPAASGAAGGLALSFVIQKHWARRLHYDFRLELDGAMKSWAVPKGPSFDPSVKRMAVQVEDHPIAYADFQGTIPAHEYGAGKVMIWDRGTWRPFGDPHLAYQAGHLKFELHGTKLHGKWALVRMQGKSEKQAPWLLIKEKDAFVRPAADFSVVDEMPDSVASLPAPAPGAVKADLPATLAPQLATSVSSPPPDLAAWSHEIKFDGYRLLVRIDAADIKLFTRTGNDWSARLVPLKKALAALKLPSGWYDGEIVVLNEKGVPDFGALQRSFESGRVKDIVLYLFDLPFFDGHDMRGVALGARRDLLRRTLETSTSDRVRFSEEFDAPAQNVLEAACKLGLEGVLAKRRASHYVSRRSADWIKLKCGRRQEFVVGGFTDPQGVRTGFGALLLGVYDPDGALHYAGKVGAGFDQRTLMALERRLRAMSVAASPFVADAIAGRPHWVKPTLVAEVSFGEWTRGGHIRHAVFRGMRDEHDDKEARSVVREPASTTTNIAVGQATQALASGTRVTHPERVIDASTGTTKIDLVRYYGLVGDLMMEHLRRPVSLLRAPNGVTGGLFFQKHAGVEKLPGIRQLDVALDPDHPAMLEVAGKQGLLSAAQWNVIEFHTRNCGSKSFARPDRMVFDLDPGEGVAWRQIQEAAELVRAFLMQLGLSAFLKTSGGKGLHVVVPLRKAHGWDAVKDFSLAVVRHLAGAIPDRFVARSGARNRVGKIYIDTLRNGSGATTVCAWSARARPGLGISVPVGWDELKSLKGGDHWSVRTAHARLDQGNEPWAGYRKAARGLTAAIKLLG